LSEIVRKKNKNKNKKQMKKGTEVKLGFIPANVYKVLVHKVEVRQSSKGFKMAVAECEIVAPETATAAGTTYKTLGAKGNMYVMLENKNGVDSALELLASALQTVGLYDGLPEDYSDIDVAEALKSLQGQAFNMLVASQPEYVTDDPSNSRDLKFAKRDENGEAIIKRYNTQFDFSQVKGVAAPLADSF
jgi:hypothetical protein